MRLHVNFNGVGYRSNTSHHNVDPFFMETHFTHKLFQTISFYSIICFTLVKFHNHLPNLTHILLIDTVHCFKSNHHIIKARQTAPIYPTSSPRSSKLCNFFFFCNSAIFCPTCPNSSLFQDTSLYQHLSIYPNSS